MEWAQTQWYVVLVSAVVFPLLTEALKKWQIAAEVKRTIALLVSVAVAAGGLLLDGKLTWATLGPQWAVVFSTGTIVYQVWSQGGGAVTKLIAPTIVLALVLSGCGATTNYNITFHGGAFRVADSLTVEPGQAGSDSSTLAGGTTAGGTESSPGGSNINRGFADQLNIFQIGTSQKPETTATVDAKASATVQSPNSQTGTGGETGATGSTPTVAPAPVPTP